METNEHTHSLFPWSTYVLHAKSNILVNKNRTNHIRWEPNWDHIWYQETTVLVCLSHEWSITEKYRLSTMCENKANQILGGNSNIYNFMYGKQGQCVITHRFAYAKYFVLISYTHLFSCNTFLFSSNLLCFHLSSFFPWITTLHDTNSYLLVKFHKCPRLTCVRIGQGI